ncbi:MAG: hypothetical protein HFI05_01615 [Lachnospiraceae bacterium]|jgi:hypothetical protein|nr:hypothetical protein [Lachnospiraceae bacterium]
MNIVLFAVSIALLSLNLDSINSIYHISDKSIMKIEDIEIDDLVYKSSDTGIELTNHSRIIINSIPIEDENGNITIGIYSYNDNTQKTWNYNGNTISYDIKKDGLYSIYAIINNDNKEEKIDLIPYIIVETCYTID